MTTNNSSISSTMEEVLTFPKPQQDQRRLRAQPDQALKCPRCDSTNTKFCYYNNYSLSQPRYFCKGCRRYWTQGGTLRNVPVGGGCRKNKRSSSSSSKRSILSQDHDQVVNLITTTNSNTLVSHHAFSTPLTSAYDSNDLTLAFARLHNRQPGVQLGLEHHRHDSTNNSIHLGHSDFLSNSNITTTTTSPFVDALRNGYLETQQVGFHHNFNNGFGNEDQVEGGGEVMVLPYDHQVTSGGAANTSTATVTTTTKKEFCKGRNEHREDNVRGFWNFPWHIGGGHQGSIGGVDVDSGRECWNGIGSSWHGLINSPLM